MSDIPTPPFDDDWVTPPEIAAGWQPAPDQPGGPTPSVPLRPGVPRAPPPRNPNGTFTTTRVRVPAPGTGFAGSWGTYTTRRVRRSRASMDRASVFSELTGDSESQSTTSGLGSPLLRPGDVTAARQYACLHLGDGAHSGSYCCDLAVLPPISDTRVPYSTIMQLLERASAPPDRRALAVALLGFILQRCYPQGLPQHHHIGLIAGCVLLLGGPWPAAAIHRPGMDGFQLLATNAPRGVLPFYVDRDTFFYLDRDGRVAALLNRTDRPYPIAVEQCRPPEAYRQRARLPRMPLPTAPAWPPVAPQLPDSPGAVVTTEQPHLAPAEPTRVVDQSPEDFPIATLVNAANPHLEASYTDDANVPAPNWATVRVYCALDVTSLATARQFGLRVVWLAGAPLSEHPTAFTERLVATCLAMRHHANFDPDCTLVDVGSDLHALHGVRDDLALRMPLLGLMPNLSLSDSRRIRHARSCEHCSARFCQHKFEVCDCNRPDSYSYLCIHSLYYLNPRDIAADLVRRGVNRLYAIHHRFHDVAGSLCSGELQYHIGLDGYVNCVARGNVFGYHHPNIDWLNTHCVNILGLDGQPCHLSWATLETVGDTFLTLFTIESGHVDGARDRQQLITYDWRDTHSGDADLIGRSPAFANRVNINYVNANFDMKPVRFLDVTFIGESYFLANTNDGQLPIPRGLIGNLAAYISGKPRTPDTFKSLLAKAHRDLRALRQPDSISAYVHFYACVLAFDQNLAFETATLGHANARFNWLRTAQARVSAFNPLTWLTAAHLGYFMFMVCLTFLVLALYGLATPTLDALWLALVTLLRHPATGIVLAIAGATVAWRYYHHRNRHRESVLPILAPPVLDLRSSLGEPLLAATRTEPERSADYIAARRNDVSAQVTSVVHHSGDVGFPGTLAPKNPSVVVPPSAELTHGEPPVREDRQEPRDMIKLLGIGFGGVTPYAIEPSNDTFRLGLLTRMLREWPAPEATAFDVARAKLFDPAVASILKTHIHEVLDIDSPVSHRGASFPNYTLYWIYCHQPVHVQPGLRRAYDELCQRALTRKDCTTQGFVKVEKTAHILDDQVQTADPRTIQACRPERNVAVGPWHHAHFEVVKKRRNLVDFERGMTLTIAIGLDAESVGANYDALIAHYGGWGPSLMVIVLDQSRMEGHQSAAHLKLESDMYRACGAPPEVMFAAEQTGKLEGTSQIGDIYYRSDISRRSSGISETSKGTTFQSDCAIVTVFGEPGPNTYGGLIMGDDAVIIGYRSCMPPATEATAHMKRLGFDAELVEAKTRSEVEFCSALPWPTADGTVFGRKLGRTLVRLGYTTSLQFANVHGIAVGNIRSVNHIPFLREFNARHVQLCPRGLKPRKSYGIDASVQHDYCPDTWAYLHERYGLDQQDHARFLELLSTVKSVPATIPWDHIYRISEIDD